MPAAWRSFLLLLGRSAEELLVEGGICPPLGARPAASTWRFAKSTTLRSCANAQSGSRRRVGRDHRATASRATPCELDEATLKALLEIASDAARLARPGPAHRRGGDRVGRRTRTGPGAHPVASAAGSRGRRRRPRTLETIMTNAATAAGQLSPEVMLELLTERYQAPARRSIDVVGAMVDRMSDADHRAVRRHVGRRRARRHRAAGAGVPGARPRRRSPRPAGGAGRSRGPQDAARP